MTKTLQEIQEFNRRQIICAVHNTEDYEEALRLDYNDDDNAAGVAFHEYEGKPITLSRVLLSIDPFGNFGCIAGHIARVNRRTGSYEFICKWELTKETLKEQSEETQREIYKL